MEATLLASATAKPASRAAKKIATPFAAAAPSITLPLRFIVAGLLSLFAGVAWLIAQPGLLTTYHYNQNIIALTHLFVLGWLCSVVMGAMYQLVPVALETKLYSERLARWHFGFHVIGFIGMVWMFKAWNLKHVGHFGATLAVGVALFVYNLARTLKRVPKWNVVATAIAAALARLTLTVTAGLLIAAGKSSYSEESLAPATGALSPLLRFIHAAGTIATRFDAIGAMHAHAHLGVVGLFTGLIVGVSYKLVPMFTLSELQNPRRALASVVLLNAGLLGAVVSILLRSPWKFVFALVIVAALALYAWELIAILRARKRAVLDWGVKGFLTAIALLIPLSLLALVLSWPRLPLNVFTGQLENLYGFLGLIGFVSFAIVGMLHKIVPFLVWFGTYSRHVGRAQVPSLAELFSESLQRAAYWTWLAGLAIAGGGIVLQNNLAARAGAMALAASLILFAMNLAKILSHFFRPVLKPFPSPALSRT